MSGRTFTAEQIIHRLREVEVLLSQANAACGMPRRATESGSIGTALMLCPMASSKASLTRPFDRSTLPT